MPASCVLYAPEAQGSLRGGPHALYAPHGLFSPQVLAGLLTGVFEVGRES